MNSIGRNIEIYRRALGLTQEQVASFLGINREVISYYETGTREIPFNHLMKISDLLHVTLEDLLEENAEVSSMSAAIAFRNDKLDGNDLSQIANFGKFIKNYLKVKMLVNE